MRKRTDSGDVLYALTALSPLDGRYRRYTRELAGIFSEYGYIRMRLRVESAYLVALSALGVAPPMSSADRHLLTRINASFDTREAHKVKDIERVTNHDVKAVEIYLRSRIRGTGLAKYSEYIHIGITSEDVNNVCYRLFLTEARDRILLPKLTALRNQLTEYASAYRDMPMLGRTHGQAAVPTTVGHEFRVFVHRLEREIQHLSAAELTGKWNGAVGNMNALRFAYPDVDWLQFAEEFIRSLGLVPNAVTTQINPYEDMVMFLQTVGRMNGIIVDLDQDMWRYISDGWFVQEKMDTEVGSSTMPQKVNPIHFENSEGNAMSANAVIEGLSRKLSTSRLQRDLSDCTSVRNIGVALGHSVIAYDNCLTGLAKISPDMARLSAALNADWSILTEALQTVLRKHGVSDAYDRVKDMVRGKTMTKEDWITLVGEMSLPKDDADRLMTLTPRDYIGYADTT